MPPLPATGPLQGLRVLDLTWVLSGPFCTATLSDLGADVVKLERPPYGDVARTTAPIIEAESGYFFSINRGKRSIEADFESEDGKRIVKKLAARSDVLIENFKVGGLAKFGLDYNSLAPECPRLIYCSVTGFGQDGPYASRAGYDLMAQGMGGFMSLSGTADGEPTRAGVPVSDIFTGVYSVIGILAALAHRERTGKGCCVDTALVDSTVGVLANQGMNYLASGKVPQRIGNAHPNIVPYQVFSVADGYIIIATGNDSQYVKLCGVLGVPEFAKDPRYIDNKARLANRAELVGKLTALTMKFNMQDLADKLEAVGVPAGPINTIPDVVADPQVLARNMIAAAGGGRFVSQPIRMGDGAAQTAGPGRPAPALGADTDSVLASVGYSAEDIARLRAAGAL